MTKVIAGVQEEENDVCSLVSGLTIIFAPPGKHSLRANSLFGSLWAPFTVLGPGTPAIAGAADGYSYAAACA